MFQLLLFFTVLVLFIGWQDGRLYLACKSSAPTMYHLMWTNLLYLHSGQIDKN